MGGQTVPPPPGLVVALTGGIAAGKSLVAAEFARLGIVIVDTDAIAHQLTGPGGAAIPALVAEFGPDVLDPRGALDRPAMRARAFADPALRRRLEAVLHPRIRTQAAQALASADSCYAMLAVPLLAEAGPARLPSDRVLVVDCPELLQRSRALTRPGLTPEQLDGILAAQATRQDRLAIADEVIDNSSDVEHLRVQVQALDRLYRQLSREARP
jgi:dephospho-CoA kinase